VDVITGLGALGIVIFLVILGLLSILLPFSAYAAQKWAHSTYKETKEVNAKLEEILSLARVKSDSSLTASDRTESRLS
jgi:hypothetical protein